MNLKRALITFTALMLLPVVAQAQRFEFPPPITPAEGTANIVVLKRFGDGNREEEVEVNISCTAGTIAPDSVTLGDLDYHIFVIDNLPEAANLSCTVTENTSEAYEPYYLCGPDDDFGPYVPPENIIGGDEQCWNLINVLSGGTESCSWTGMEPGGTGYCFIYNNVLPVEVEVTKVWEEFGTETADVDTTVELTLVCDGTRGDGLTLLNRTGIIGGDCKGGGPNRRCYSRTTLSGADFEDEDGDYTGMATAVFSVRPAWYSTAEDPTEQEYTECFVREDASDNDAVEVHNGCGESFATAKIKVAAGMGDECTITNTVFFEGIPTLSQYGMMIMALLMLGVGFVGLRRFV